MHIVCILFRGFLPAQFYLASRDNFNLIAHYMRHALMRMRNECKTEGARAAAGGGGLV